MPIDLHCMICQQVYYKKENEWMDVKTYIHRELGTPTSGVYHHNCVDTYLRDYVPNIPQIDKTRLKTGLEQRILRANLPR